MKIIDYWSENGFNVVITANFVKDGDRYHDENWRIQTKDIVYLESTIYNPYTKTEIMLKREAYGYVSVVKYRWFRDHLVEDVTIYESYKEEESKLIKQVKEYIKKSMCSKDITDGLPNSLIGL